MRGIADLGPLETPIVDDSGSELLATVGIISALLTQAAVAAVAATAPPSTFEKVETVSLLAQAICHPFMQMMGWSSAYSVSCCAELHQCMGADCAPLLSPTLSGRAGRPQPASRGTQLFVGRQRPF